MTDAIDEFIRRAQHRHADAIERALERMLTRGDLGVLAHFAITDQGEVVSGVELSEHVLYGIVEEHPHQPFRCPRCAEWAA